MNHNIPLRIISMALAAMMSIVVLSTTAAASAAEITASAPPHADVDAAPPVTLSDVTPDKWFYDDVMRLVTIGVISGYPDGNFYPEREISNAEFVKILLSSIGFDLDTPVGDEIFTDNWATEYLSLAYTLGFITDEELEAGFLPETPITRAAMTRMMVMALGIEPAPVEDPFIDTSDDYAKAAYGEYLLKGIPDGAGGLIYNGEGTASRSEAAAIAIRVIDYNEDPYEYFKNAVLDNATVNTLDTEGEMIDLFYVLNREFMTEFTFRTTLPIDVWTPYYRMANIIYLEYFYSSELKCSYIPGSGTYKLILEYEKDLETLKKFHAEACESADEVVAEILDESMTPAQRVKAIHDYLILYCEYDYVNYVDDTIPLESRVAYGPLKARIAVCQGYTAAFNMLCKRAGIRSAVVTGTSPTSPDQHAWNMILLDGRMVFVDVTHDDPVPDKKGQISYKYYLRTEDEMTMLGYLWNKEETQLKYLY
ncbi:MAG: S-layer homology domain-containing protein [Clostridia bacterium]|nr:S-layer homology domain-containing protein [Clostridia bacterium]